MVLLLFYFVLAIGVSFLCSILEAVLLSMDASYIAVLEQEGSKKGAILGELKSDIDRPLSAILTLNTIAHTVGAAGVGAQTQVVLGNAYVSVTSVLVTLAILVFSEIIPKTLGATYWKKLSGFAGRATKILIVITYPFVLLSQEITKWLSSDQKEPTISREEFSAMAELGFEQGVFEEGESTILKNLIRFHSLKARDVMTPRIVVIRLSEELTIEQALEENEDMHVSRIPVFGNTEENITGYVLKNDLYYNLFKGNKSIPLKEIKRDVTLIPETVSLKVLFERLLANKEYIAVAVDEYGGLSGVVTMEDVVETLLGMEIVDEIDTIEDMQQLARQKWRERAKRLGIVLPDQLDTSSDSPSTDSN
ncbi:MAG: CNNM domain-containing protein [Candidatus Hydrogenedentota bacterium]